MSEKYFLKTIQKFLRQFAKIVEIFKGKGYENIEFKDGRDVYNFIKDYQRNVKKGKQDTRTEILSAISEDVTASEAKKSLTTDVDNLPDHNTIEKENTPKKRISNNKLTINSPLTNNK